MGTGRGATQVLLLMVGGKGQPQPYTGSPTNSGLPEKPSDNLPLVFQCVLQGPWQVKMLLEAKRCLTIILQQKTTQTKTNTFLLLLFNFLKSRSHSNPI